MTWASAFNVVGLLMNLAGVILLFRYGMPYRVRTEGNTYYVTQSVDAAEVRAERWYEKLGILGLALIVLGTAAQIASIIVF
jgi:hypothetical protein